MLNHALCPTDIITHQSLKCHTLMTTCGIESAKRKSYVLLFYTYMLSFTCLKLLLVFLQSAQEDINHMAFVVHSMKMKHHPIQRL